MPLPIACGGGPPRPRREIRGDKQKNNRSLLDSTSEMLSPSAAGPCGPRVHTEPKPETHETTSATSEEQHCQPVEDSDKDGASRGFSITCLWHSFQAGVLVFGERSLLLLGPATQRLLDIHPGLLVPSLQTSSTFGALTWVGACICVRVRRCAISKDHQHPKHNFKFLVFATEVAPCSTRRRPSRPPSRSRRRPGGTCCRRSRWPRTCRASPRYPSCA